jgi:hypothetical protein
MSMSLGKKLARVAIALFGVLLCLVLAFYGFFGYEAWKQREQVKAEASALKKLFSQDDGVYLYVNVGAAELRKDPTLQGAVLDTLGYGQAVFNFSGSRAQIRDGFIFVQLAPDSATDGGWIRVSQIVGAFPDLDELAKQFHDEKDAGRQLDIAQQMADLEPGNPEAWKRLLLLGKQRKDAKLLAGALEGQRASKAPVLLAIGAGGTWGPLEGTKLPGNELLVGTRLATSDAKPRHFRFQGGNGCHIHAMSKGDGAARGVVIASNRPASLRKIALDKLAPQAAAQHRNHLLKVLEGRDDVPENIREEVLDQLMGSFFTLRGTPYLLVSSIVKVPSEGDRANFRANMLFDTTAASPEFIQVLTEWTMDEKAQLEAFSFGEKNPALTFMIEFGEEGMDRYEFYQFDPVKHSWLPGFTALVPGC